MKTYCAVLLVVMFAFAVSCDRKSGSSGGGAAAGPSVAAPPKPPPKPAMPVEVTYRDSSVGEGYVAKFRNTGDKYLRVVVTFTNPTTKATKSGAVDIKPHETAEVGWLEGWTLVSGDLIDVDHADYEPIRLKVP